MGSATAFLDWYVILLYTGLCLSCTVFLFKMLKSKANENRSLDVHGDDFPLFSLPMQKCNCCEWENEVKVIW